MATLKTVKSPKDAFFPQSENLYTCEKEGKNIKVAFQPISAINQQLLCVKKNAIYFDLNVDCAITDLNISAWSVHKVNLFEAFDEAGFTNLPRPD